MGTDCGIVGSPERQTSELNDASRRWYPAFRHPNYRLFFFAQIISLNGTWMQLIAEGWMVYELTDSTRALGITRFLHTIPVTFITLGAGLLADRIDKRNILVLTQFCSMLFAGWLTWIGFHGELEVRHLWIAALGIGICHAFDIPARQSFIVDMVGRKDLMNALFINSSVFNGARIIGPGVAGLVIALFGPVWCFLINTLSFGATIHAYRSMKNLPVSSGRPKDKSGSYRMAISYIVKDAIVWRVIATVAVCAIFTAPFIAQIPSMAKEWYGLGPKGYGSLMMANGIGAFIAAIFLTTIRNPEWKKWIFPAGTTVFGISVLILSQIRDLWMAHIILGINGLAMISTFSTANTLTQMNVPGSMRGRIMGIYSFCFIGLSPFGNLLIGDLATRITLEKTLIFSGVICLIAAVLLTWAIPAAPKGPVDESQPEAV